VSKYIGETEKNLNRIFQEASNSNAILQFDEADALLGKRSEVKDAHDRYANIEVAYLLQKMEAYDGIVILTTNMRKNLDDAFVRRMHLTIEFPFPDPPLRLRIWENIFPNKGELLAAGVDLGFLAQQFDLAGGNIRNAALAAAFNAAERGSRQIEMKDLILATASELHKMGRLPSKASFRQYYDLIRDGLEAVEPVNG
jgi:SpoVK/Ycf46/Vps4 family AAA+-type ATPase